MGLRIIGAGLPRTGTSSLKLAIERLIGEPCYHMFEVIEHRDTHGPLWHQIVVDGDLEPLDRVFEGYGAAIDWPASMYWPELLARHPDAIVVLSHRNDPAAWWRSVDRTVWEVLRRAERDDPRGAMVLGLLDRLGASLTDPEQAMATYERWNETVRSEVVTDRLVTMTPAEGWGPLCAALGVAEPDDPYPVSNTTDEFRRRAGWD